MLLKNRDRDHANETLQLVAKKILMMDLANSATISKAIINSNTDKAFLWRFVPRTLKNKNILNFLNLAIFLKQKVQIWPKTGCASKFLKMKISNPKRSRVLKVGTKPLIET